jgi:hypothetical protein
VIKHHPRSFQISFCHSFHQFHPISRTIHMDILNKKQGLSNDCLGKQFPCT